jgi:class 3 adenylate cyclase
LATVVHLESDDPEPGSLMALASRQSERFKGRIVATPASGVDAVFDGPARAIRYAAAVSAAGSGGNGVHAGIQTGEVELTDGGASGPPLDIARQLAALGNPGQVLATGTVRDLVAGSGIRFARAARSQTGPLPGVTQILVVERESLV